MSIDVWRKQRFKLDLAVDGRGTRSLRTASLGKTDLSWS